MKNDFHGAKWDRADRFLRQHREGETLRKSFKWRKSVILYPLALVVLAVVIYLVIPNGNHTKPASQTTITADNNLETITLPTPSPISQTNAGPKS